MVRYALIEPHFPKPATDGADAASFATCARGNLHLVRKKLLGVTTA
jgi:hypothetical protein